MLSVQEVMQEHHTLIATLQNQVSLQQHLLSAQATFARQDQILTSAPGALGAPSQPLTSLTAPPAVAQAPMIVGDVQPEGYVYISMNQGLAIWGHPDIVQASLTDTVGKPRSGIGDAAPL
jgi:hypothetical protein